MISKQEILIIRGQHKIEAFGGLVGKRVFQRLQKAGLNVREIKLKVDPAHREEIGRLKRKAESTRKLTKEEQHMLYWILYQPRTKKR